MSVKINVGFSSKETINFQSTMHSISLEMDVVSANSTKEVEEASSKLFALCKKIISTEKGVNVDSLLKSDIPAQPASALSATQTAPVAPATTPKQPSNNGNSPSPRLASSKQIKFILELAKKAKLSHDEILSLPTTFQKERFEQLTAAQASTLIDRFSMKKAA